MKFKFILCAVGASALAAGCFNEPVPAERVVPKEARVYLTGKGLSDLSAQRAVLRPEVVDYVNLDHNSLTNVDEVASLENLKWLRLNDNRLTRLPNLSKLVKLRRIYLARNQFAEVPAELKELPQLESIDLSDNPIAAIPAWLAEKKGLLHLSLNRTRIRKLPADLSAWQTLKTLQLGDLTLEDPSDYARIRAALPNTAVVY